MYVEATIRMPADSDKVLREFPQVVVSKTTGTVYLLSDNGLTKTALSGPDIGHVSVYDHDRQNHLFRPLTGSVTLANNRVKPETPTISKR